jgi:hypothetical protein
MQPPHKKDIPLTLQRGFFRPFDSSLYLFSLLSNLCRKYPTHVIPEPRLSSRAKGELERLGIRAPRDIRLSLFRPGL